MSYIVKYDEWGITTGSLGKPPYTQAQYQIALDNVNGIQNAIYKAQELHHTCIVFPKAEITLRYVFNAKTQIIIPSFMVVDLGGSTIDVMYDSDNLSPEHQEYQDQHPSTVQHAYDLSGVLFGFRGTQHAGIKNGIIRGDVFNRSFSSPEERKREQTYGIGFWARSYQTFAEDIDVSGFMGDGFVGQTRSQENRIVTSLAEPGDMKLKRGFLDYKFVTDAAAPEGEWRLVIENKEGAFYSNEMKIHRDRLRENTPWMPDVVMIQTLGGYVRIPSFGLNNLEALILKSSDPTYSRRVNVSYLGSFTLKVDEDIVYIQDFEETTTLDEINRGFTLADTGAQYARLERCNIHDNHRGGVSNMPDFLTIKDCTFHNNGMDCGIGAPIFPDTTRYQINLEDVYARQAIIENCKFHSSFSGILLSTDMCHIKNCVMEDNALAGIVTHRVQLLTVDSCRFMGNALYLLGDSKTPGIKRNIIFTNNKVDHGLNQSGQSAINTFPTEDDANLIIANNVFNVASINCGLGWNVRMDNNDIKLNSRNSNIFIIPELRSFSNNRLIGNTAYPSMKVFLNPEISNGNYIENINFRFPFKNTEIVESLRTVNMPAGIYKNCTSIFDEVTVAPKYPEHRSHIKFKDSTIDNCAFKLQTLSVNELAEAFADVTLKSCTIKIGEKSPFSMYIKPNIPSFSLEDCRVDYTQSATKPKLLSSSRGTAKFDTKIKISNTVAEGVDDFKNYIK